MEWKLKKRNSFSFVVVALAATFALTACTPPMPPEVKAEIAERYVTCVDGSLTLSVPNDFSEVAQTWIDGLTENCLGFTGSIVDANTQADVVISTLGFAPSCDVVASSPVGLDAVAISVSVEGLDGVVFSPSLLYKALSGEMTSWADPELQALNPDLELTDSPVVLRPSARPQDIEALNEWMTRLDPQGWPGTPSGLSANEVFDSEAIAIEIQNEGTLSVLPASFALGNSAQTIRISGDQAQSSVGVDTESIYSAGTQFRTKTSNSIVTAEIDSELPPLPVPGSDEAALPWQAINLYSISVCNGANEMLGRAFSRFALRLDSQGTLPISGFYEVPEQIRTAGVDAVSQGLPEPTIPPTDAPAEVVPTEFPSDEPTDMPSEVPMEEVTDAATPEPTS